MVTMHSGLGPAIPNYVPETINRFLSSRLDGDSWNPIGWRETLTNLEDELQVILAQIRKEHPDSPNIAALKKRLHEAEQLREDVNEMVQFLLRLGFDSRMEWVYKILKKNAVDEVELLAFFSAAWVAQGEYHQYRLKTVQAERLAKEVGLAAERLAVLIDQFSDVGVNGPAEFYSIQSLLETTDNTESRGHNMHMWRSMRTKIFGRNNIDHSWLSYAWGTAPAFTSLLRSISRAGETFHAHHTPITEAAISSRQENPKNEYLRAFCYHLLAESNLSITSEIKGAIAIVCEVCIDDPDQTCEKRDVTAALNSINSRTNPG